MYAGAAGYPRAGTPDPRHFPYLKGSAQTVESLGGKWAPSASYGRKLMDYLEEVKAMEQPKQQDYAGHWAEASIRRVIDAGVMNGRNTGFAPNEPITRAEVAVALDRLLKSSGK
ncbi:S-layer homology domain-containing protein [Paenibacillus thiaminolyticus]|nr:S-layer homology domain-containing protein [Paenibacillus thiaminolyticus]